jgi:hypothetical protein
MLILRQIVRFDRNAAEVLARARLSLQKLD